MGWEEADEEERALSKESMDANKYIDELLKQLEDERRNVRREKLAVARLQREVARSKREGTMREKLIHELEEERRLRLESEKRLREVTEESELGRAQMLSLQQQFLRMEETVRSLLQNQGVLEQTAVDTVDIMKAYKDKLTEEGQKQHCVPEENGPLLAAHPELEFGLLASTNQDASLAEEEKDKTKVLLERLKALEEKNSALASENESQREQYERCLDEVANQVVLALLTQKDLREECLKLRTRVFDLEQQNRALGILFQQKIKPASDLLLQKLHSRIMDLSAADLLLEPEKSKAFLLSRNTESPPTETHGHGKPSFHLSKCLSQLSLTMPAPLYQRSSCSSSELSLSSACSEYSSGSYTWNDGRSCSKMTSLNWETRLSLGSSAPSNICALPEDQRTRRKETNILEGLRKLQRRRHRSSSMSKISKAGYKDCMNSNEGIYSLGIKSSSRGVSKPTHVARNLHLGSRKLSDESDDADDELAHSSHSDKIPTKDNWFYCKRLSRSISDSLCSWEGTQDNVPGGDHNSGSTATEQPPAYDPKERPEKLTSCIRTFLPVGEHKSAFSKPSAQRMPASQMSAFIQNSDTEDREKLNSESNNRLSFTQPDKPLQRLSRDMSKQLAQRCLQREQGRTLSADGRPQPCSLIKESKAGTCSQSEESVLVIFDAEGQPIELCSQKTTALHGSQKSIAGCNATDGSIESVRHERPSRQRNYTALESPEKPCEYQSGMNRSSEKLAMQATPPKKLVKPGINRNSRGHSIPPMNDSVGSKPSGSKIPGRNKHSPSPLRVSKGSNTDNSGPSAQERSPLSPLSPSAKVSRFSKASQSTKAVNSKLSNRNPSSNSSHLSRKQLDLAEKIEQPIRDKHCETMKNKLRSPSPPLPPGRTTSLLIRPNYEASPQAHKFGVTQQATPTTVRGPPPSYHNSNTQNMQATLPIKDKDLFDKEHDAGYGTSLAPQKLVGQTGQHLQKSPVIIHAPTKGTFKRITTKDYLPTANSGHGPEHETAPKSSKNVPPPYSALNKRGTPYENGHQLVQKSSVSLPLTDTTQAKSEPHNGKDQLSPLKSPGMLSPNSGDRASKSRIPMGFKAFLKSPPSHKHATSIPAKLEKDQINLVSKDTVILTVSTQSDNSEPVHSTDSPPKILGSGGNGEVPGRLVLEGGNAGESHEEEEGCIKDKRGSQLFSRSISVTTKPHLKPALGMNGAKARSQSFSTNYIEKPNINVLDGPVKIRTQIITNSGERGNSLSRQTSLEVPSHVSAESPLHSPRMRLSHYGGMTGSSFQSITEKTPVFTSPPQKDPRTIPITNRDGVNNIHKPGKVVPHSQFQAALSSLYSPEKAISSGRPGLSLEDHGQKDHPNKTPEVEETQISSIICTIEEKVMLGIEENLQKSQEHEKNAMSEMKQKTVPSLANWFGLKKSKLPALSGKKADSPKGREEKRELKIGSVLGGIQMKSDKRKDKKKNDSQHKDCREGQNQSEVNNKLSAIMDHCNNQMGQIANQIQCTTAFLGKDQFVKEILGRSAGKTSSVSALPPGVTTQKKHAELKADMEICPDTATLLVTQKINLKSDNKETHIPDTACQDHMMGSSCQMRTLDSGIGTFPLPDSVTRTSGRHIPKSESNPDGVTTCLSEPDAELASSLPDPSHCSVKVPSLPQSHLHAPNSLGHSLSDPALTSCGDILNSQCQLPQLRHKEAIRTGRLSFCAPCSNISTSAEDKLEDRENSTKAKDSEKHAHERVLRVCTYSGSSDTETEIEGSTLDSSPSTLVNRSGKDYSVESTEKTLQRCSVEKVLSIMDYYHNDMYAHMDPDSGRIHQYKDGKAGLSVESPLDKTVITNQPLNFSLESLNQLNHSSSSSIYPASVSAGRLGECLPDPGKSREGCYKMDEASSGFSRKPGVDPVGSLSDSLYDSFSSCTSQGSNDV
ncbi:nck-associated protein 5-like isoform X3 [Synchiropus splendidus]|uniref:nck-associated protein 5-like isoform X3 n=1 Tax=Synchiropus splendidus TaxID=270530 RepID=UPI00237D4EB8|nr:nck-associated protein 5-like isoform X3 [Synchiropus splendidus]